MTAKARSAPRPAPRPVADERFPVRLSPRPASTVVIADVPNVGRVRLTLTPKALAAARPYLDRHDLAGALRAALRSVPQ